MNFRAVLVLSKTVGSAQTHKVWVSFQLFGALYMYISVWFPKLSVSIHSNTSIKWINCTTSRFFNFTASKLSMYAQFWCWVIGSWQMPSKSGESIEKVDNWWWMAVRMWLQFDRRTTAGTSRDLIELKASDPMGHHTWVDTIREVKVG